MKLSRTRFQKGFPPVGCLFAAWLFAGCSHLYYADPNPATPFAFPGQSPTTPAGSPSAPFDPGTLAPVTARPGTAPTPPAPGLSASDTLRVGDTIVVAFSDIPLPGLQPVTQRIRDDQKITLPYNVTLVAAGKTVGQLQEDIRSAYVPNIFVQMTPSVNSLSAPLTSEERVFFVDGEVKVAGRLQYKGEMTVLRAITSAGGFTDFGKRTKIELRRANGQKLFVNWYKAIEDSKADLLVYPNDHIIVRKKLW